MVTRQLGGGWGTVQRNRITGQTKDLGGFESEGRVVELAML